MRYARCLLALVIWILASCSGSLTDNRLLDGDWVHVRGADEPPGFSLNIVFATSGNAVSGTGTWQGEAMPGGTVSATGDISRSHVTLDFAFTQVINGVAQQGHFVEHFVGAFTSGQDLEGTMTLDGMQSDFHLHRNTAP
jgi:hypothetical protein